MRKSRKLEVSKPAEPQQPSRPLPRAESVQSASSVAAVQVPRQEEPKCSLEEAFSWFYEFDGMDQGAVNLERGVRAVAFLLTWCSEIGNEPVDGNAANGLARILDCCADYIKRSRSA